MTSEPAASEPAAVVRWAPYVIVPPIAAALAVGLAAVDPGRVALGLGHLVGVGPLVGGATLVVWTALAFREVGETLSPIARPASLVTRGPLERCRNPMYLGVVATVGGVAVLSGSPAAAGYAAALGVAYHAIVVLIEEPRLRATFGERYERYCDRVPRWLPLGGR